MQDAQTFNQAVCESRESDRVVKFLTGDKFTDSMQQMLGNDQIHGVYYTQEGELVAEDIWQQIHTDILR